ncbi:MAG TPA: trehalase family glycosidase, partial [Chitinophagaceae bacterium]|nr:trehalase family glycosidase [Chitinophagaceae bacterium]
QWDAPNGWAPLQWITIKGLENYGYDELAHEIAGRWIRLNTDVFKRTGKLMEKYNVEDTNLEAGGGEYKGQDGFGWTNGVLIALIKKYGMPG